MSIKTFSHLELMALDAVQQLVRRHTTGVLQWDGASIDTGTENTPVASVRIEAGLHLDAKHFLSSKLKVSSKEASYLRICAQVQGVQKGEYWEPTNVHVVAHGGDGSAFGTSSQVSVGYGIFEYRPKKTA